MKRTNHYLVFYQKIILALVCACSAFGALAEDFSKGLLWKIERSGVEASYLFGTMHSDHPSVVKLAAPVQQAFDRARGVILELVLDPDAIMKMASSFMLSDGSTLESLVGPDLYKKTLSVMSQQGMPEVVIARMKPWAVAVSLMTPPTETGVVLDHVLYKEAVAAGKKVNGLETVEEQMGLFDSLSKKDQVALLKDTLDSLPRMEKMLADLQAAYLARDLSRLVEINEDSMHGSDPKLAEMFTDKVITERNHRMAERMQPYLRAGGNFVAVGALHLPGPEGLLKLLSQSGYQLTPVY